ncbi:Mu-like prophage major head subunit gpT family protein [Pseudorhodobacter sp.]|uniref:Mu-like prophage major head subunit gpT family protein n=1 Tax=Pseudorhodobacter sp. TaxID=1934400 RepID=UPI002AFF1989|nr:Mu-like prophage major head subunit gpT family protein [Pseudorhodobacter sp.]
MIINGQTLNLAFKGFQTIYNEAQLAAESHASKVAMMVPSSSRDESYGWLGQFPRIREWIGPRHINNLKAHGFTIKNINFELTVAVPRNDIADDRLGIFAPMFSEMGRDAATHPDELIFDLLKRGFEANCFDGKNFFDEDHPIELTPGADPVSVSNMQDGTDPAWFLLDLSRGVRPIIWQEREKYEFQSIVDPNDSHVFMNDEYVYGVRARVNAGFGLWQLAFGSKQPLTEAAYMNARAAMMSFKSDGGRILGVKPTVMVVPPELENFALHLLNTETNNGGGSNPWKNTVELIVTPYVA